ncbi:MAG: 1-deoxy-D-xylulose-5-phosphate synthase [Firmicutes bacterium]|nr:1-deoxy-D-xylulose-5-phosphate synthase [Bacillota bacterium]
MKLLPLISSPDDLKKLSIRELELLAEEIRHFLVSHVSTTGGHLSSNLGVVELTLALERELDLPKDKLIFDVGHQSYVHKILTGRADDFVHLRQKGGLSGFPKGKESIYDAFDTGHASTSISAAYGLAKARDLTGENYEVACVIGDGSMTGGMAYEAMNNAGKDKTKLIVVLNDNEMAISRNVGSLSTHLSRLRTRQGYLSSKNLVKEQVNRYPALMPLYKVADKAKNRLKYLMLQGILFGEMGFTYLGPVDGHNLEDLIEVIHEAKKLKEPVLIHVTTIKGKGYAPAQNRPDAYHGISCGAKKGKTWSEAFGEKITSMARKDPAIVAITAAMRDGVGLIPDLSDEADGSVMEHLEGFPSDRLFDVGIAEEHAVTFAGGLAKGGMKPFVAIYSTFLQRAYDQMLHDVCLTGQPVVFAVDHSGIVGEDGETHQGVFDTAYLSSIPGMVVLAPSCKEEMEWMMEKAVSLHAPAAIKYPKGRVPVLQDLSEANLVFEEDGLLKSSAVYVSEGPSDPSSRRVLLLSVGDRLSSCLQAASLLEQEGYAVSVVNVRCVHPIDTDTIASYARQNDLIICVEEQVWQGSFSMQLAAYLEKTHAGAAFEAITLPDAFISHDTRESLLQTYGLNADGIVKRCLEFWKK